MTRPAPLPRIRHKHDLTAARALVAAGYPAVADLLPHLLSWVKDFNWPVATIVAPFLAEVGTPVVPALQEVLRSNDHVWRYWCISCVIAEMDPEVASVFSDELERIAQRPTAVERYEDLDEVATEALAQITRAS